jgi:hypothetical protein
MSWVCWPLSFDIMIQKAMVQQHVPEEQDFQLHCSKTLKFAYISTVIKLLSHIYSVLKFSYTCYLAL